MSQFVARPGQECKNELIVGAGLERVRWTDDTFNFDGWCSETRVGIKEKMVLETVLYPLLNIFPFQFQFRYWQCISIPFLLPF